MRCDRCGYRMKEEQKDTFFRGPVTFFTCVNCGSEMKRYDRPSLISSLFLGNADGSDLATRRAEPVSFSSVGKR